MTTEIIAIAVGFTIAWLLFTWAIRVLKASLSTVLIIGTILLILQIAFGIHSQDIWQESTQFMQKIISNLTDYLK